MIKIIKLILNFLKTVSCKLGFCCGSKCESGCNGAEIQYEDGSIIEKKETQSYNPISKKKY